MNRLHPTIERIRDIEPFSGCTDDELAFVASRTCDHHARAGDILAREGRTGREFGVIVEGTATVLVGTRPVARLGPGDFFGEVALLDHDTRVATVVAETDVDATVSTSLEFAQILDQVPAVARRLLVGLARRLRRADQLLAAPDVTRPAGLIG